MLEDRDSWFNRFSKSYIYNLKSYIYFFRILVLQFSLSILLSSYLYREAFYEFSFQDTVYLPIILQFNAELQVCVLQTVFHSEFIKLVFWSIINSIFIIIGLYSELGSSQEKVCRLWTLRTVGDSFTFLINYYLQWKIEWCGRLLALSTVSLSYNNYSFNVFIVLSC